MSRVVVNVAFGFRHFMEHQQRLILKLQQQNENYMSWWNHLPIGSPTHRERPYAFKAFALAEAAKTHTEIMWADSSIVPIKRIEPIWEYAEEHGVWMSHGGWSNYEWTADSAYLDLLSELFRFTGANETMMSEVLARRMISARATNKAIPHVAATAFALNLNHEKGKAFLAEYYRLASETDAFCGPWKNTHHPDTQLTNFSPGRNDWQIAACGPADVRGHRHDQSCASVIAWRLGIPLTRPPEFFAYGKSDEVHHEGTVLLADGSV